MEELNQESTHAKIELVRNPIINQFIMQKVQLEGQQRVLKIFNSDDVVTINHDELYNDIASYANNYFDYSREIRDTSNMRYLRSDSELIPKEIIKAEKDTQYNVRDRFLVPYDYILVIRSNGTQFLIAESFSSQNIPNNFHKYSIIRYGNPKNPFIEDKIYSDGIDIARILSGDENYLDVFANDFLSEQRLNESLANVYNSLDAQQADETNHGGGYVGYIDSKDLTINKTIEKNELLSFEKKLKEEGETS